MDGMVLSTLSFVQQIVRVLRMSNDSGQPQSNTKRGSCHQEGLVSCALLGLF